MVRTLPVFYGEARTGTKEHTAGLIHKEKRFPRAAASPSSSLWQKGGGKASHSSSLPCRDDKDKEKAEAELFLL